MKAGDRVRFKAAYNGVPKGTETTIRKMDAEGLPILEIDAATDDYGWSHDLLEIVSPACEEAPTLRDQFAMAALTGMLGDPNVQLDDGETLENFAADTANAAYIYADAMMAERERGK